jgi:hypothetical protein
MRFLAMLCALFFTATLAIAQEAAAPAQPSTSIPFLEQLTKGDFLMKVLGLMAIIQMMLYCVAECLTRLSDWLDTKSPSKVWVAKVAAWTSEAAWFLGGLLGKFGYGTPKLVMQEKAKEIAASSK